MDTFIQENNTQRVNIKLQLIPSKCQKHFFFFNTTPNKQDCLAQFCLRVINNIIK